MSRRKSKKYHAAASKRAPLYHARGVMARAIVRQTELKVSAYLANADHIDEPYEATTRLGKAIDELHEKVVRLINTGKRSNGKYMISGYLEDEHETSIKKDLESMFAAAKDYAIGVKRSFRRRDKDKIFHLNQHSRPQVEAALTSSGVSYLGFTFHLDGDITVIRKSTAWIKHHVAKLNLRVYVLAVEGVAGVKARLC